MKPNNAKPNAPHARDDTDALDALYPKRLFIVPDMFHPDPNTAYRGFIDERSEIEKIGSYFQALRPYFQRAIEQANQDVAESSQGR